MMHVNRPEADIFRLGKRAVGMSLRVAAASVTLENDVRARDWHGLCEEFAPIVYIPNI